LDETYIKIGGKDRYWYRAVDKQAPVPSNRGSRTVTLPNSVAI
jgi:hypothetical protein